MSDTFIIIVPEFAFALPAQEQEAAARALASQLFPDCDKVESHRSETPELVYAIENRGTPICPACGADLDAWWWDELEGWLEATNESELVRSLPCCRQQIAPNEVHWVDGSCEKLARFQVEIMNANSGALTDQQIRLFEHVLGCPVAVVYRWL